MSTERHSWLALIISLVTLGLLIWNHFLVNTMIQQGAIQGKVNRDASTFLESTLTDQRSLSLHFHHDIDSLCRATGANCTGHFHTLEDPKSGP